MKLVSFNLQHCPSEPEGLLRSRVKKQAAFLNALQPDVLALQEVTPQVWEILGEEMKIPHAEYLPREDGSSRGEGVPVLVMNPGLEVTTQASFWLSDTPECPSKIPGAVHPRVCSGICFREEGKEETWLFNIHLDHRNARVRRRSLEILRERIGERVGMNAHCLLCGDFNMPGTRKEIQEFCAKEPGLEDATRFHQLGALRPTYLGWGPFKLARARIDLCLHSPGLRVREYHALNPEWLGETISDHRALVVDLVFSADD